MWLTSFHLRVSYSSHAIISLPSDGRVCLTEIASDVLLKLVKTFSELRKLSPHPLLLERIKMSSLLDWAVCEL